MMMALQGQSEEPPLTPATKFKMLRERGKKKKAKRFVSKLVFLLNFANTKRRETE